MPEMTCHKTSMKDLPFLRAEVFSKTTPPEAQDIDQLGLLSNRKKKKSIWILAILLLPKEPFMVEMSVWILC